LETLESFARLDLERRRRTGIPETVFAEGKTPEQVISILAELCERSGFALATRVGPDCAKRIDEVFTNGYVVRQNQIGRTASIRRSDYRFSSSGGCIGILAAGTSDLPVAEEAKVTAEIMGCKVLAFYDVGVAGIHRLVEPLRRILEESASAIVVVAGMEGALPSVVRGLVPIPVIGVPTSIGYGYGARGEAALMSMLQSCAPGLSVVNIDNGFGAGATAALIANRVAEVSRQFIESVEGSKKTKGDHS
jgi:NCAIR mutase (PurE)-related protein